MGSIISGIIAVAKAVPIFDKWLGQLFVAYAQIRIASMKKENVQAIKAAIEAYDQRAAEIAIGSPHAGEPTNLPGSIIVDTLPGVTPAGKNNKII